MAPYWVLAAYAAGIALPAWLPPSDPSTALSVAVALGLLWLSLYRSRWASLPLAAALTLAGLLWAQHWLQPPCQQEQVSQQLTGQPVAVEGVVRQIEQLWDGGARLDVAVERLDAGPASGLVRLTIRSGEPGAEPGDRVCWRSRLRRPTLLGTPGEFDYPAYLAARDIYVTTSIERATDLARLAPGPAADRPFWARCRYRIATAIARALPTENCGLVQALTVGVASRVTPEQRRLLSAGGLAHLFSISGLHFGLLALLLYVVASWLYGRSERLLLATPPRRVLPLLLLLPLTGYLLLSGDAAPTRRSYLTTVLGAALFTSYRRTVPLALLATVALLMLTASPLNLFEASFQLSFAGVLGLIVWVPRWQHRLATWPSWLRPLGLLFLTTLAATLATAPLTLWHFHQLAPAGLVSNLVAVPLVTWGAVPAGLLGAGLLPFSQDLAGLCFACSGALVDLSLRFTNWVLSVPGMTPVTLFITTREYCGVLLLVVAAMVPFDRRRLLAMLLGAGATLVICPQLSTSQLQVTALSVGQGDATLLSLPDGRHFLVDGGGSNAATVDIGERLVGPALGRLGVRHLDGVILTHNHPDHSGGLPYIVDHFRVDGFWTAIPVAELDQRLAASLSRRRVPVHLLPAGWTPLGRQPDARLNLFVPSQKAEDLNDRSIVVHAADADHGVLLSGDLAVAGFTQLCAAGLPDPVSLLKLPHHGSRGSRPERFLDQLQPALAFVSAGLDNAYGLPHPATLAACRARQVPLYRTDHQGTLTFTSCEQGWQIRCYLEAGD